MKYNLTTPCDECHSGFTHASLMEHAVGEFACHKACDVDENDSNFVQKKNGKTPHCAGALIFLEKRNAPHQMMRIVGRLGMYDPTKLNMAANVGSKPQDYRRETDMEKRRREQYRSEPLGLGRPEAPQMRRVQAPGAIRSAVHRVRGRRGHS